jgi:hypothetical protein
MMSDSLIKDLEEIVDRGLEDVVLPFVKGNFIRIKNYVIREGKAGFLIYNTDTNERVALTQFKSSAIAITKNLASGYNVIKTVMDLDRELTKHYNDAIFYKNIIKKSDDYERSFTRRIRLNEAILASRVIREKIDRLIFGRR